MYAWQHAAVAELSLSALAGTEVSELLTQAVALIAQTLDVEYSAIYELEPDCSAVLLRTGVGWKESFAEHEHVDVETTSLDRYAAPVMTGGNRMWVTPTYHALRLHVPHIGATALPVEVEQSITLPDGNPAVSATASHKDGQQAITLINRHYDQSASVRLVGGTTAHASGQLLTASSPREVNSADQPDRVAPTTLRLHRDGDSYHVELPPHSLATVVFQSH